MPSHFYPRRYGCSFFNAEGCGRGRKIAYSHLFDQSDNVHPMGSILVLKYVQIGKLCTAIDSFYPLE